MKNSIPVTVAVPRELALSLVGKDSGARTRNQYRAAVERAVQVLIDSMEEVKGERTTQTKSPIAEQEEPEPKKKTRKKRATEENESFAPEA